MNEPRKTCEKDCLRFDVVPQCGPCDTCGTRSCDWWKALPSLQAGDDRLCGCQEWTPDGLLKVTDERREYKEDM